MGNIKLAYSTFGLTRLDFAAALDAVARAGYDGVEISFHRDQFNPFSIDDADLAQIRSQLDQLRIQPACVATAAHFFNPMTPHEPSLMAVEAAGRKRRIGLVKRGIHVARRLGAPLVTFGSGFIRPEHLARPDIDPGERLAESIHECIAAIGDDEDITLLIEPEPGMYIETTDQALALVEQVNSPRFGLHVDLCHAYCSEHDLAGALEKAAPHTRYLHVSDAQAGYNLKVVNDRPDLAIDLNTARTLVHFEDDSEFLLLDENHPVHFYESAPDRARRGRIEALMTQAGIDREPQGIEYSGLYAGPSMLDDEIFTWMISQPGLSFDVLERTRPIVGWLRGVRAPQRVDKMVANTLTGIVHFHDIPGRGTLDFETCFRTLARSGFSGYGAIELYHHIESWQTALDDSRQHLLPLIDAAGASS